MKSITYEQYLNKVYGGWMGKCIGGIVGFKVENNKMLMDLNWDNLWPDIIPFNDDLDIQVLWLDVLEKKGVHLTSRDLADAWLESVMYIPNEYGFFRRNYENKIQPPVSGWYNNEFFKESMGSPIRSEIWGYICPGNPELAAEYAAMDAVLDHQNESVWGEQFYAAIEARAFFEKDIKKLIREELRWIDSRSELFQCISFIIQKHDEGWDWIKSREAFINRFLDIDASKARINIALTVLALLFGEQDFGKTILIAVNSGYDTDCTAATAGAILGQVLGADHIPVVYSKPIGEDIVLGILLERHSNKIIDLALDTCKAGLEMAFQRNGNIQFKQIPLDLTVLNRNKITTFYEMSIDYSGLPAIGWGDRKTIFIKIKNLKDAEVFGNVRVEYPENWLIDSQEKKVALKPGEVIDLPFILTIPENMRSINTSNILRVSFNDLSGNLLITDDFGLVGAALYKMIGPFWDIYDTRFYDECPWFNDKIKSRPLAGVDYSNFVNLHKPYVDERNFDFSEGKIINAYEDKLDFAGALPANSPCCIYLEHHFHFKHDKEMHLVIGNNDSFKIWFNDEEVAAREEHRYYTPFNHLILIRCRKGMNRIVIKLLKNEKSLNFSLAIRSPLEEENFWWINNYTTSLLP